MQRLGLTRTTPVTPPPSTVADVCFQSAEFNRSASVPWPIGQAATQAGFSHWLQARERKNVLTVEPSITVFSMTRRLLPCPALRSYSTLQAISQARHPTHEF